MKQRERGAAILTAMLTVTLVATFAAAALWQQWRAIEVESAERSRVQASWVLTGALDWAWDLGNPAITKLPPEGESYTRETPNMWTTAAYDDKLGRFANQDGGGLLVCLSFPAEPPARG